MAAFISVNAHSKNKGRRTKGGMNEMWLDKYGRAVLPEGLVGYAVDIFFSFVLISQMWLTTGGRQSFLFFMYFLLY